MSAKTRFKIFQTLLLYSTQLLNMLFVDFLTHHCGHNSCLYHSIYAKSEERMVLVKVHVNYGFFAEIARVPMIGNAFFCRGQISQDRATLCQYQLGLVSIFFDKDGYLLQGIYQFELLSELCSFERCNHMELKIYARYLTERYDRSTGLTHQIAVDYQIFRSHFSINRKKFINLFKTDDVKL